MVEFRRLGLGLRVYGLGRRFQGFRTGVSAGFLV